MTTTSLSQRETSASTPSVEARFSAHLYGSDLDRLLLNAVVPFWRELRDENYPGFLWLFRHDARAPHLKLHLHGPSNRAETERSSLRRVVMAASDSGHIGPMPEARPAGAEGRGLLDALDGRQDPLERLVFDDASTHDSHFGVSPRLAHQPDYAFAYSRLLGLATDLVLEHLNPARDLPSQRQNLLFLSTGACLHRAFDSPAERLAYLRYHYQWILRYLVLRSGFGGRKATEALAHYEQMAQQIPEAFLNRLREIMTTGPAVSDPWVAERLESLGTTFGELKHIVEHRAEPADSVDPFHDEPFFPSLLKLLHILSNQLGFAKMDEGFLYYVLARALGDEGRGFCLAPLWQDIDSEASPDKVQDETEADSTVFTGHPDSSYDWATYVLESCSDEAWLDLFEAKGRSVFQQSGIALDLLRRRQLEEGRALLEQVAIDRAELASESPSMFEAIGRFYFGALAYHEYLVGNDDAASRYLDDAYDSVNRAIEEADFLTPLAPHVLDIPLQKARIARRRADWSTMEEHLFELRALLEGDVPLCRLRQRPAVTFESLGRHFDTHGLSALSQYEQDAVQELMDPVIRQAEFRRHYVELYVSKWKLLPYP